MACVLVVEDEPAILMLLVEELADAGHDVRDAFTAEDAEDLLTSLDGRLDVLVTDINMGTRGWGFGFARRARAAHPDVAVIYITGDAEGLVLEKGVARARLLAKPFTPLQLVGLVGELAEAR